MSEKSNNPFENYFSSNTFYNAYLHETCLNIYLVPGKMYDIKIDDDNTLSILEEKNTIPLDVEKYILLYLYHHQPNQHAVLSISLCIRNEEERSIQTKAFLDVVLQILKSIPNLLILENRHPTMFNEIIQQLSPLLYNISLTTDWTMENIFTHANLPLKMYYFDIETNSNYLKYETDLYNLLPQKTRAAKIAILINSYYLEDEDKYDALLKYPEKCGWKKIFSNIFEYHC